jgi:CheY-like chemotaxis protein
MTEATPRRRIILLVDDEPDILYAYQAALEQSLGVKVETASSAVQALSLLTTLRPDVVISDYRMPAMNGIDFLTRVRGLAPGVPLVMLTAYPDSDLEERARRDVGVARFFSKTIAPGDFVEEMREMLAHPPGSATVPRGKRPPAAPGGWGASGDLRPLRSGLKKDGKGGAPSWTGALHPDLAPVQLDDPFRDEEPEPRPGLDVA